MLIFTKTHVDAYVRDGQIVHAHDRRPMYVSRKVLNADELHAWAMRQGFKNVTPADKMHVTVAYSRAPVHHESVEPDAGTLMAAPLHLGHLGDEGAVVLHVDHPRLHDRWHHMRAKGASWDHEMGEGYKPHVSISYKGQPMPAGVKPFDGDLHLGPERVEDLKTGWGTEVAKTADKPMTKAIDVGVVLFTKARVGAYMRGGKLVNLAGYQGRDARAAAAPGQMALFSSDEAPAKPNPFKGKDPVLDTPDLFDGRTPRERGEAQPAAAPPPEPPAKPHPLAASAAALAEAHERLAAARASGKGDGFESHVAEHRGESHRALEAAFAAYAKQGDGTELSNKDGRRHAILLPDASSPGKYRYQTFDASGFSSHSTHDTPEEAVADAASQGYHVHNPGILDKLAGTDEWAHGMAINAVMQAHNSGQIDWRTAMDRIKALGDEREAKKAAAAAPAPAEPVDNHPSKPTRSLLNLVPEDRRAEWQDLHRRQHEMHHYDLGLIRADLEKARSPMNRALTKLRESEAAAKEARKGGDLPGTDERIRLADDAVARHRAEFDKRSGEVDRLKSMHQTVYERVAKLGRQKEAIASATGDMDIDWASMKKRTPEDQAKHEKAMLAAYREHYKALRGKPLRKSWDWLGTSPLKGQLTIFNLGAAMPQKPILFLKSYVNSYTRSDGTVVEAHERAHGAWRRHDEHTYSHPSGARVTRGAAGGDNWDLHQTDGEVRRGYKHPMAAMHDADLNDEHHKKVIKEYGDTVNDQRHERRG